MQLDMHQEQGSLMPRKPPTRRETTEIRHTKFAENLFRLGNASAALRETYPASKTWTQGAVAKRAWELSKEKTVIAHLELLSNAAMVNSVADRNEVERFLVDVMRGNINEIIVKEVKDKEGNQEVQKVEVPVSVARRIAAAKQLAEMVGYNAPIKHDVGMSAVGAIPQHMEQMSDDDLTKRLKEIEG
jgi:hypothetical protein